MNSKELLQKISNANGPSGFEDEVSQIILEQTKDFGEQSQDSLLNIYIKRTENVENEKDETDNTHPHRPTVLLDAHMDEVGFIVQAITNNGLLRILGLGGWLPASAIAQKVRVRTSNNEWISGVIASKPPHFASKEDRSKMPEMSDLRVDIGAESADEAKDTFGIRIGAPVVPDVEFTAMPQKDGFYIGKAFDDRIGCAANVLTLKELQGEQLDVNITAAFSVQEEVGTRGARVVANRTKPDIAICFEGTPADDTFSEPYMIQAAVGKGPMLRHFDSTMIANPRFQRFALDLAKAEDIPCQESVRSGGGTNAGAIHLSDQGIPTIVIGVPVRYIHSHHGIASLDDLENAAKLAAAICRKLSAEVLKDF